MPWSKQGLVILIKFVLVLVSFIKLIVNERYCGSLYNFNFLWILLTLKYSLKRTVNRNKIVDLHIARYFGRCDEKSLSNIIVALQQRKRRKTKHRNKINDNLMAWHCARESEEKGKKSTRFSSTLGKDKGESFQFPWFRPVFEITPRPWAFLSKKRTHVPPFILRLYLLPFLPFFFFSILPSRFRPFFSLNYF